ncbi:MAG: hypothetical protein ABIW76_01420 [Fibrobacteria bacterium]
MKFLQSLKWILILYLMGWAGIQLLEKAIGRDKIAIPGVTKRKSALGVQRLQPGEILLSRSARVDYNLIVDEAFPWFLPKRSVTRCRYDNIADNRGLSVAKVGEDELHVSCRGPGQASLRCEEAIWTLTCSAEGELDVSGL